MTYTKNAKTAVVTRKGQAALVVAALLAAKKPMTPEEVVKAIPAGEYEKTFKPGNWAVEKANGVLGSVKYHLRGLVKAEAVTVTGAAAPAAAPANKAA